MTTPREPASSRSSFTLLTAADVARLDAAAVARGTSVSTLMERAGEAITVGVRALVPAPCRCLVLCGPGNNGGDGFVAARLLTEVGYAVTVAALAPSSPGEGAASEARAAWSGAVIALQDAKPENADIIIDALFGTGLGRDLDGEVAALVGRVNASEVPVIAVDMPSGIDSDTGQMRGAAIRATGTVTFVRRKLGQVLYPGRSYCGFVTVADIGISDIDVDALGSATFANAPDLWPAAYGRRSAEAHKYDRGHTLVLSGGPANTGAARLAARGALRVGAGLVSVVTSARALSVNAAHLTAIMLRVCDEPDELSDLLTDDRFNALLLGPALGVGEAARAWVEAALDADRGTVLDADALMSFSGELDAFASLTRAPRETPIVLTPHDGEFARLFAGRGEPSEDGLRIVELPSKVEKARAAAALTGAVVILKGPDTAIAAPDGRAAINENGTPDLGTAGSGDVLGGFVAGLLAQGVPGFEAAAAAVWLHAEAGRRFGPGLIAEDLPEALPAVLRDLLA